MPEPGWRFARVYRLGANARLQPELQRPRSSFLMPGSGTDVGKLPFSLEAAGCAGMALASSARAGACALGLLLSPSCAPLGRRL